MQKHTAIPEGEGLYWYYEKGTEQPRPVFVDHARWKDCFKSFNGSQQSWLREGEYLIGPQPAPRMDAPIGLDEALPCVTDPDAYRALCEALVEAETSDDLERAGVLRAMVDAAAFGECPSCNDKDDNRPDCTSCGGEGFVPIIEADGQRIAITLQSICTQGHGRRLLP